MHKKLFVFYGYKNYIGGESAFKRFFGWHISFLKIYEQPKDLNEFICNGKPINRPPQSWCYIEKQRADCIVKGKRNHE